MRSRELLRCTPSPPTPLAGVAAAREPLTSRRGRGAVPDRVHLGLWGVRGVRAAPNRCGLVVMLRFSTSFIQEREAARTTLFLFLSPFSFSLCLADYVCYVDGACGGSYSAI